LNLPQARAWKKFRVEELFTVKKGKRLTKANMQRGTIRFIGATSENNGVTSWISNNQHLHPGNTITVSYNGSVGESFYQDEEFWASDDINVLYPKFGLKREVALYFITATKSKANRYSYTEKWVKELLEKEELILPVLDDGNPDYLFIEAYVKELESSRVAAIGAYLKSVGLDDCDLTADEEGALKELSDGTLKTSMFTAGNVFVVNGNPQLNKESFEFSAHAEYPYFTRTVFNNGILGYVNYLDEGHKISGGSLAVGMLGMQFFYMGHDYYAGQFTKSIRLKAGWLNERTGLFFATLFNKAKGEFQKGLVRDFERLFSSLEIRLPVNDDGAVDFEKMENLVSACMKQTLKGVIEWIG